ncbi:hypothetical protein [Endozoicomonas sp. GU-1]|uniref:hypothetical protein n=1 Tax=Endozoicomonas sp. GU-1 TaxID=3009078 RepID=UPI0022B5D995|nr:hypothetical protein [Endozoicomonas sp. GU-1]WBA81685.1 hypothetical protein O2T12_00435 [Endozoicomonas sp. GU-1]WBA84640.1 hypothetical protein O3276_15245 [Endozoicomonas sp. GU-1]
MDGINNKNISANIPQQDCLNNQQPETQKQTGNPPNDSQGYIPKDNGINSEIPQGSMIDRKIEKLKAEGRDYQLKKVNPSEEVSLISACQKTHE